MTRWTAVLLAVLGAITADVTLAPSVALGMPNPHVKDGAGFFSADAVAKANGLIQQIKRDSGKDVHVETHPTIPAELKSQYSHERRGAFFSQWADARAKELDVDGLIVLINREPSYLQVRIGKKTSGQAFIQKDSEALRTIMQERFKARDFDGGLVAGVQYVADTMAKSLPRRSGGSAAAPKPSARLEPNASPQATERSQPTPAPPPSNLPSPPSRSPSSSVSMGTWLCLGIGAVVLITLVMRAVSASRRMQQHPGGPGHADPRYGPSGHGQPGYGQPGYGGGGGGGFGRGMLGGLLGGVLGGHLYDRYAHGSSNQNLGDAPHDPGGHSAGGGSDSSSSDASDFSSGGGGGSGGDFGGGDSGGGGGGDSGGDSGGAGGDF